jgi:hypothetical protein
MPLNSNPFVEGIDPTGTFGGFASVLLQLIRQAQPSSTYGMILFDTDTPDVSGANAWRKRCVWLKTITSPASVEVYVYRSTGSPGWINIFTMIPSLSITTAMIANASVTLAKLSVAGGAANQLIRVNGAGTAFEFVNFAGLITPNSIPVSSLRSTGIPPGDLRIVAGESAGGFLSYTIESVLNEAGPECLPVESLIPPAVVTPRGQFPRAIDAPSGVLWSTLNPDDDFEDNSINGTKLANNTTSVTKLIPGSESQILTVVGGVPVWSSTSPITPTQFRENFVFATNNFDFPSATGTTNVDIPLTLPAGREWKDVELTIAGDLVVTNGGVMTASLKWNTGAETGLLAVTSTGGTGQNSYGGTAAVLGTTFRPSLRWKGLVPSSIKSTNITLRLQFTCTTFLAVQNSLYTICARATANS